MSTAPGRTNPTGTERPPRGPSFLLGIGLGGFVDGILLHQILQWHHLLTATGDHPSDTVAGLEANTLADGLFHAGTWVIVLVGSLVAVRSWRAGRIAPPWAWHIGWLLIGWSAFNVVEGVVNHHLLQLHHVRDDVAEPRWWDVGFLLTSVAIGAVGWALTLWSRSGSGWVARRGSRGITRQPQEEP